MPVPVACVVGAKGGWGGRKARAVIFRCLPITYPFDACYAGYLLEWWPYWFQMTELSPNVLKKISARAPLQTPSIYLMDILSIFIMICNLMNNIM